MIFQILWNYPAIATFYALHPDTATKVDGAVIRFAETGQGDLEWVSAAPSPPGRHPSGRAGDRRRGADDHGPAHLPPLLRALISPYFAFLAPEFAGVYQMKRMIESL
jgi:hypothetical protein